MKLFIRWLKFLSVYMGTFLLVGGIVLAGDIIDRLWAPAIGVNHVFGLIFLVLIAMGMSLFLAITTGDDK